METIDFAEAMYALDLDSDDAEDVARFMEDQAQCNCDEGYQCFNLACRERVEKTRESMVRLFSNPAVREHYRPVYGFEGGIRYKINYDNEV